jgi:RNA polymerase sigma factor (sigma-70 family)
VEAELPAGRVAESRRIRFERLYEDNSHLILAYALRRTDRAADAADVVSSTFLVAWRRLDDLPEGDRARLWLYGTARRVLANHFRSLRRARALNDKLRADLELAVEQVEAQLEEVEAQLTGPSSDALAHAFGRLSGDDQELLTLVGVEGLDRRQVADVLGCSRANVRIRLHRARRRFANELERVGIDPPRSSAADPGVADGVAVRSDAEEAP